MTSDDVERQIEAITIAAHRAARAREKNEITSPAKRRGARAELLAAELAKRQPEIDRIRRKAARRAAIADQAALRGTRRHGLIDDVKPMSPKHLREALERLELSQSGFAAALGIDPRTVRRYCQDPGDAGAAEISPPVAKLVRLLLAGKISIEDLRNA